MITAIVRFKLRPAATLEETLEEIGQMIPFYQAQDQLVRKQICLDLEKGEGRSIYLWRDRAAAEAFFAMARPILRKQTGAGPDIELLETHVIVDNSSGEVWPG